jgi:membrane-associated HD superfamily phosphohydrolase
MSSHILAETAPLSELRLIKRCAEFLPRREIKNIPPYRRGIYALLRHRPKKADMFDVVYIGIAAGTKTASIRGRLRTHERRKGDLWTHFSIYEVWDNIREEEIRELEGIFRHIYRLDSRANRLNKQRSFKKLKKIQDNNLENWKT